MIRFRHKGDFSKTTNFLNRAKNGIDVRIFDKYGQQGVAALMSVTPVDTGATANAWYYKIEQRKGSVSIGFYNSNIQNGVLVAILLQYGHGTNNGGWVEGQDYINPAIQPLFDEIVNNAWREVTKS